jgi:hypothetical protein
MNWRQHEGGPLCKCGELREKHTWLCDECGSPATGVDRYSGCGEPRLARRSCDCQHGLSLYCPPIARVIDAAEWAEHRQAVALHARFMGAPTVGAFRVREAERLRGLSA